jgi:predicted CXXCH cytochrome family protein
MSKRKDRKSGGRRIGIRLIQAAALLGLVMLVAGVAGVSYAAHLENNDIFCASCHTQPESNFVQRSVQAPVDLASSHAAQQVDCIQCHSGTGPSGRLMAMASVALPDLLAYRSGQYHDPAIVTVPISDDHCLKCHSDVTQKQTFDNHFHVFLSTWQSQQPQQAAKCVDCHESHNQAGDPSVSYLVEADTVQVCQSCHRSIGQG